MHRRSPRSSEILKEFVSAFCDSFNQFFPGYGREQIEFAIAQFLHPYTKGSGLVLETETDRLGLKYYSTKNHICDLLQPTTEEEESQSIRQARGPSQVVK